MNKSHLPWSPTTRVVLQSAAMGMTMGAAVATATQLKRDTPNASLALGDIARASVVTGLATGTATLVGQSLAQRASVPRFAAMFVAGTALFYLLNQPKSQPTSTALSGVSA